MIIVIDGPAGSGKSSTAKTIANRINLQYLDSGALYRAVTWLWINAGKPELSKFFDMLTGVHLQVEYIDDVFNVKANGKDLTTQIRSQEVAGHVSEIASLPEIRSFVNRFMKQLVEKGIYIADGRDLGTAVFPGAFLKFYMDASLEERAKRRFRELENNGQEVTFNEVKENLRKRDWKDQSRKSDPLKKADDAILIDTTGKTFDEQITEITKIIEEELNKNIN
ncbi:MAG: (d)CMP kinase [Balneolaceae bacterium]|nr:MAG: (d)CMP kinase [Balneolaceae bacterium]